MNSKAINIADFNDAIPDVRHRYCKSHTVAPKLRYKPAVFIARSILLSGIICKTAPITFPSIIQI